MKKWLICVVAACLLSGCGKSVAMEEGLDFRGELLGSSGCSFQAEITADYGDELHTFTLLCRETAEGTVDFQVLLPESIQGLCGSASGDTGAVTFQDTALSLPLLAEEQIAPVSAPWLMLRALRSGYIASAGFEESCLRLSIEDTLEGEKLQVDVWLAEKVPVLCELCFRGRRILTVELASFEML